MKKFFDLAGKFVVLLAAVMLALLAAVAILPDAIAQVENRQPTPMYWYDYTGTNSIGFNVSAGVTVRKGTTVYTGATTNVYLTNVFALRIVDGQVVGIITP